MILYFMVAGGFVAVFLFNKYKKTPAGHIQVDTMLLKIAGIRGFDLQGFCQPFLPDLRHA